MPNISRQPMNNDIRYTAMPFLLGVPSLGSACSAKHKKRTFHGNNCCRTSRIQGSAHVRHVQPFYLTQGNNFSPQAVHAIYSRTWRGNVLPCEKTCYTQRISKKRYAITRSGCAAFFIRGPPAPLWPAVSHINGPL